MFNICLLTKSACTCFISTGARSDKAIHTTEFCQHIIREERRKIKRVSGRRVWVWHTTHAGGGGETNIISYTDRRKRVNKDG